MHYKLSKQVERLKSRGFTKSRKVERINPRYQTKEDAKDFKTNQKLYPIKALSIRISSPKLLYRAKLSKGIRRTMFPQYINVRADSQLKIPTSRTVDKVTTTYRN